MRIDKYLKVVRVIKRRTIASEACDKGRVRVNDKTVKPSYDIKINDIVEVGFGDKQFRFKILEVKEFAKTEEIGKMIEIL